MMLASNSPLMDALLISPKAKSVRAKVSWAGVRLNQATSNGGLVWAAKSAFISAATRYARRAWFGVAVPGNNASLLYSPVQPRAVGGAVPDALEWKLR